MADVGRRRPTFNRRRFLAVAGLTGAAALGSAQRPATARAANTFAPATDTSAAPAITAAQVIAAMRRAADYWMTQPPTNNDDNNWHNSTFHNGNMALYNLTKAASYLDFTRAWAQKHGYTLISSATHPYFPDYETAGQPYLDLYQVSPAASDLTATEARIKAQIATGKNTYWNYVDALHMAMPVFARYGVLLGSSTDLEYAYSSYHYCKTGVGGKGLWDTAKHLWWRDGSYINGSTYWSRGNGWAIAAHAKVLGALPLGSPHRDEYVLTLQQHATALAALQRKDGFWNASLTNPAVDAGPETSGTALHTFAIAFGINNGMLSSATFRPVVERAWQGMVTTALQPSGRLGYVQGPGSKPSDHYPWGPTSTQPYGVGAFLLAGAQMAALEAGV